MKEENEKAQYNQLSLRRSPFHFANYLIKKHSEDNELSNLPGSPSFFWGKVEQASKRINRLQSTQVKSTPQDYINEFIVRKLNRW